MRERERESQLTCVPLCNDTRQRGPEAEVLKSDGAAEPRLRWLCMYGYDLPHATQLSGDGRRGCVCVCVCVCVNTLFTLGLCERVCVITVTACQTHSAVIGGKDDAWIVHAVTCSCAVRAVSSEHHESCTGTAASPTANTTAAHWSCAATTAATAAHQQQQQQQQSNMYHSSNSNNTALKLNKYNSALVLVSDKQHNGDVH